MTQDACCGDPGTVDMIAEAREAQWTALSFMGSDAIKIVAPAKVNLFLGIGKRLESGYHEVQNVMHALALHDNIYMTCREEGEEDAESEREYCVTGPADNLRISIDIADKTQMLAAPGEKARVELPVKDNLVFKAINALAREVRFAEPRCIDIRIEKHIPMQAGLGGGSSDAAAALVGFAHFIGLSESGKTLHEVASKLGADVAFFLKGGCGFFTGIGDVFERQLDPMKHPVVLVKPDAGVSTAECYAAFDASPVPVPADLAARAEDASDANEVPLFNNLAPAACSLLPELAEISEWLSARSSKVLLSGSGSATYAVVETYADAARIAGEANARGWWARATSFSSLRALKV